MPEITVTGAECCLLKDYLRRHEKISLTLWRRLKRTGIITINGLPVAKPALACVQTGDVLCWELPEASAISAEMLPLDIIYEDDCLLAVNKPAGQLVHPTVQTISNTLANAVMYHYQQIKLSAAYHPIHRLDKDTSGLLLIAKQPHIQNCFTFSAAQKSLRRRYLALIDGTISPLSGQITLPIGRKSGSIIERTVTPDGKPAITCYKTLATSSRYSLLEIELFTGRTHQIRVHMAAVGHPLLGDDLYGGSLELLPRQALHAAKLEFTHPLTGQLLTLAAPLPADMAALAGQIAEQHLSY